MVTKNDEETKRSKKYWKKNLQNASYFLQNKLSIHSKNMHWAPTMIQGLRYKDRIRSCHFQEFRDPLKSKTYRLILKPGCIFKSPRGASSNYQWLG